MVRTILTTLTLCGLVIWGISTVKVETIPTYINIQTQVAKDFERQYNDVRKHGNAIDVCVRAGLVAESYLQAGDSASYAKWKNIESTDCRAAGL